MVLLHDAPHDLGIVVAGEVGPLLLGEGEEDAGVIGAVLRRRVRLAPRVGDLQLLAHSAHRFTPVAASTRSVMLAPPTRAAVSRK